MEYPSILEIKDTCTGCGACIDTCRKNCITMVEDENGFYYPQVDMDNCVLCEACSKSCHVLANSNRCEKPEWWERSSVLTYQSKDEKVVEKSTSGGAFTFFASKTLEAGGVVFASRYNGDIERLEFSDTDHFDLSDFRKSRYMESNTNRVFHIIKEMLENGRNVLFCGTPCQVSGLNHYLGKTDRDRLLTINFICHGVPSNRHFHQWLHSKHPAIGKIKNVDFRYKNRKEGWGWHEMCLSIQEESGKVTNIPYTQSSYYLSFCQNDLLRKSCYNCQIVNGLTADITLGDFWGVNKKSSIFDDNTGLSLVILHSENARAYQKELDEEGTLYPLEFEDIEYAFQRRVYSLSNRTATEQGIKQYGYVKYLDKRYKKYILKYKLEKILPIQKILKWIRR